MSVINATTESFEQDVLKSDVPVLVDFYAEWCGPCKMMSPVLDQLADETAGKAKIVKVNVDESAALAQQFGVMSVPTLILFKDGVPANKVIGARPKAELTDLLNS